VTMQRGGRNKWGGMEARKGILPLDVVNRGPRSSGTRVLPREKRKCEAPDHPIKRIERARSEGRVIFSGEGIKSTSGQFHAKSAGGEREVALPSGENLIQKV